ncbi:HEC/Ndc80p family-domain-containing protein, partial [Syncephalis pseudoplumigaleata]
MNRRTTLGVIDTNIPSGIPTYSAQKARPSGIPVPRSNVGRPSLAPGLERHMARQSLAPAASRLAVPAPRLSNIERRQSALGRPSLGFSGAANNNAASNNNNNNNGAAAAKRLTSTFARGSLIGAATTAIQDPRPVRDKAYQQEIQASIIEYLTAAGYPHPISTNTFVARTSKDYQNMFRFLYSRLDPTFKFQKKFEEDA